MSLSLLEQMGVEDTHQAIHQVLARHPELSGQVVVYGSSFGGHLATQLATKDPDVYKVLALENPLVDFSVARSAAKYVTALLGRNFSDLFLPNQAYLAETWHRYAVSNNSIPGPSMIQLALVLLGHP